MEVQIGTHFVSTRDVHHERGGTLIRMIPRGTRGIVIRHESPRHNGLNGCWWVKFDCGAEEWLYRKSMCLVSALILLAEVAE